MAIEQERKFLLAEMPKDIDKWTYVEIQQGYLMTQPGKQLRVRVIKRPRLPLPNHCYIAFKADIEKGKRWEFEYSIKPDDALGMMQLAEFKLNKKRWETNWNGCTVCIDEYENGLRVVEIESEDWYEGLPEYCGEEVTGNKEYSNIKLAKQFSKK